MMDSNDSTERAGYSNEPVVGLERKIPFVEKLFFPAIGGVVALFNSVILVYLMYFYVNVQQMVSSYINSMILIVPLIAAALIPVFGAFIDRHRTRWGNYKPWIFITLAGTGLGAFLTFIPVNFGPTGNLVYATATYVAFSLFLAAVQAAVVGMTTVMTKRYDDRITLAFSSSIWLTVGSAVVSYTAMPVARLIAGPENQGSGLQYYALLCMIVAVILAFLILKVTKERFAVSVQKQPGFSFRQLTSSLLKNKYALIAVFFTLILPLHNIRASFNIYYCMHVFNDTGMLTTIVLLSTIPAVLGLFLGYFVVKKLGLKNTLVTMAVVNIITSAAVFFAPPTPFGAIILYVLTGIGSLFVGIAAPAQNAMIPFAADYGEWKYSMSCGGFLGSINGFTKALATVIFSGGILYGLIMPLLGYVPQGEQSAATLIGIKFVVSFLPAVIFVILLFIALRWDLTREKHEEIVREVYNRSHEKIE